MSSPPYHSTASTPLSTSPPHTHAMLPSGGATSKKRPSLQTPTGNFPTKRRKHSIASSTATSSSHPLRQTSFPPDEATRGGHARSPSVTSSAAGGTTGSVKGRGRGRPRNSDVRSNQGGGSVKDGANTASGSVVDGGRAGTVVGGEGDEEADDDDDDVGDTAAMVEGGERVDEAAEKRKLAVLFDAFTADQSDRYDLYRRVKLRKETVRRITNQTLSQSVPPAVITTINGYTKIFVGELVEGARKVQTEWMAAQDPAGEVREKDRGPLLPDHFREALRRYKKAGEGGGAGIQGLSLRSMDGAGALVGGKKLFK